jgi:hypothetical protein
VSLVGGIVLTLVAAPLAWLGAISIYGHSEIAVEVREIVATERAGVFRRVQRRPRRRLRRLEITTRTFWLDAQDIGQQSWVRNQREVQWALRGYFGVWDAIVLAYGYPRATLEAAAKALGEYASTATAPGGTTAELPQAAHAGVEIVFEQEREPPRPAGQYLRVHEDGTTHRFEFPPGGWIGTGGCLVLFGAVFAGFVAVSIISAFGRGEVPAETPMGTLLCPILLVVGAIMLIVLGVLESRAPGEIIEVADGVLRISQPGLTRIRQWQWGREQLSAIRYCGDGDGGFWLQIDLATGRSETFSGGGHALEWVAWRLRQILRLPELPP